MRSNRNSHNDLNNQKENNSRQPHHLQSQQKGVQLPPIDRKSSKPPRNGGAKEPAVEKASKGPATEDKYEQMRNRSRNNAERLQKLKDIKSQYTKKNGADKLPARKPPANANSNKNTPSSKAESGHRVSTQNQHDFEIFEMEKVENNDENIANLLGGGSGAKGMSAEDEIEALERELAQLRGEINEQQTSIAKIDEIHKLAGDNSSNQRKNVEPPAIDKNQVFGQRVKGKEISDYWNGQEQKAAFKIQQVPGGQSQVHIGDSYNFFKDKENSNYIAGKLQNKQPLSQGQQQQQQFQNDSYASAGQYQSNQSQQYQQQQQQQPSYSRKQNPNDQGYNIINPSNENSEQKDRQNARSKQQQQQEAYSQQLRDQIAGNQNNSNNANNQNNGRGQNKNAQSINIFDGYPSNNGNASGNKNDKSPAFISSLYHQQERERNNPTMAYNNQATDITVDGKKNVRVIQPPGGISQITFF